MGKPDATFNERYRQEENAALDMKEFVVGFSFKMVLSPESQVAKHKDVIPTIPTGVKWQPGSTDEFGGHTWYMCVEGGKPCQIQKVTYRTYKTLLASRSIRVVGLSRAVLARRGKIIGKSEKRRIYTDAPPPYAHTQISMHIRPIVNATHVHTSMNPQQGTRWRACQR